MAKKKNSATGQVIPERIMDWSGGQNNAVNESLLNENESALLQNYSLDEKGTLFPDMGSLERYASDLGASPVAGGGTYYKSDGTSRLLIGLEDGKLYVDSPHMVNLYDTQAEFNGGKSLAVQADAGGKLWPIIIADGFESGLFDDWHTHDAGWTIDSAVFKTGAKSAKGTGQAQNMIREFGTNIGQLYIKMAVRLGEADKIHYPLAPYSSSNVVTNALVAHSDGHFKYWTGSGFSNFPTDKTYAANTWYVVEFWFRGGTFWISIDGNNLTPSGLSLKDASNNSVTLLSKLACVTSDSTVTATMWLDDVEINLLAPVFSRASVAYKKDGIQAAINAPRFETVGSVQGVMIEEGTTNLLTANQASVETDTTGFASYQAATLTRDTVEHWNGSASLKIVCAGTTVGDNEGFYTTGISATGGQTYTGSLWVKGTVGKIIRVLLWDATNTQLSASKDLTLSGQWQRINSNPLTIAGGGSTNLRLLVYGANVGVTQGAFTFYADGLQLEQKSLATSWQLPGSARSAEVLTIPTAGVFNKGNWAVEFKFTPTNSIPMAVNTWLWDVFIDANNIYRIITYTNNRLGLQVISGGVSKSITCAVDSILPGNTYSIMVCGDGSVIRMCINGTQIGSDLAYTEPVGTLPALMYVGSYSLGAYNANGIYNDIRFSSRARTVAEHQAAYSSGLPIALDGDTTLLMSANGNLNISATHRWISPVIDCSNATDQSSGHVSLSEITPGASTVAISSRSAPASTGPWTGWVAALVDGSLQHASDDYVEVKLTLTRDGEDDPWVDSLTVSFDGQATATLLASNFTAGGQFDFGQLNDLLAVMNGIDAPRKYDGTTLVTMGGDPPHAPYGLAHKNRFWMARGSRLYFSDLLDVESWPVLNFIDIMPNDGDNITGLKVHGDYLIIAKNHSIWMLTGDTTSNFKVRRIHADKGCYAPRSLCIVNGMLSFVSDDGIYFSDMIQPVLISERIRSTWDALNKRRINLAASWFVDHKLMVAVPDANSQRCNRVIVYDTLRQAFAGDRIWPVSCWVNFREAGEENTFYGRSDTGNIRKIKTGYNDDGASYEAIYESWAMAHGATEILKRYNIGYLQVKPAALDADLVISFIVDGVETSTMTVSIPGSATGLVDTLQIYASEVGVISGHRIQIKIRQQVMDNPVGIQSIYFPALPFMISPTMRA